MPKIRDESGKQQKLSTYFGALKFTKKIECQESINISSDESPTRRESKDIKENLVKLSNEMDESKKIKFKFRTKKSDSDTQSVNSEIKSLKNAQQLPKKDVDNRQITCFDGSSDEDILVPEKLNLIPKYSSTLVKDNLEKNKEENKDMENRNSEQTANDFVVEINDSITLDPAVSVFSSKKPPQNMSNKTPVKQLMPKCSSKLMYIDDSSDEDALIPQKQNSIEIKPQPLFKISSSKKVPNKSFYNQIPKSTSTQIAKDNHEDDKIKNIEEPNESLSISSDNNTDSLKSTTSIFSFKRPMSEKSPDEPKLTQKSSESLKILDQLSSAINVLKESPPKINLKSDEKHDSPLNVSKLNIKLDNQSIIDDIDKTSKSINKLGDLQQIKDEKLRFLEYFFKKHSSVPLALYNSIEDYDKTLTVKLKGIIHALDRRQKNKEAESPKLPQQIVKTISDEEQFDIDKIMDDIEQERKASNGISDIRYVDIATSSGSQHNKFEPRINMKEIMPSTSNGNMNAIETDEDGFPIIDYSQLVDVESSESLRSSQSLKKQNLKKDTVESMISDDTPIVSSSNFNTLGNFHSRIKNDGITGEFDGESFAFSRELIPTFHVIFGLRDFRQNQLQAINASLLGHDVFILMPTGGGKSLCYQLPAYVSTGVTIVISPLKSLILDQVNKLKSLDVNAAALSGDVAQTVIKSIYSDLNQSFPTIKLLYVTPEKISASSFFQDTLTSLYNKKLLSRIVIDEAHCVSTWGHDFRPDYKKLGELKRRFPKVPIMALTATANERVRADVIHQLGIHNCRWFLSSFNRPNLKYIVSSKSGSKTLNDIIALIKSKFAKASGIIYCLSRKECDQVADRLSLSNIPAIAYHAGMTDKSREKAQENWITDKYRVVCATIAFGMGIDKPDVRYVIHYSMPKSIEGYYQESGRAGRDGALSTCILYYCYADKMRYVNMMQNEPQGVRQVSMNNLDLVVSFCENMVDCRRTLQLNYFGEHYTREQCLENKASACDNCSRVVNYKSIDVTEISKTLVSAVTEISNRNSLTVLQLVDVFKGAMTKKVVDFGHNKLRFHGCLKDWERNDIQRLLHKLIIENYLREEITVIRDIPISYVKVGRNVAELMKQNKKIEFSLLEKMSVKSKASKKVDVASIKNDEHDSKISDLRDRLYHDLMEIARSIADQRNLTIQQVINMEALRQMSIVMPETEEEMLQIPHITKANFMKYGKKFLDTIIPYSAQRFVYQMDLTEDEGPSHCSNNSDDYSQDWDALGREASTSSGVKRKSTTTWRKFSKKYKRSSTGTKRKNTKSPAKRTAAKNTQKAMMPIPRPKF